MYYFEISFMLQFSQESKTEIFCCNLGHVCFYGYKAYSKPIEYICHWQVWYYFSSLLNPVISYLDRNIIFLYMHYKCLFKLEYIVYPISHTLYHSSRPISHTLYHTPRPISHSFTDHAWSMVKIYDIMNMTC